MSPSLSLWRKGGLFIVAPHLLPRDITSGETQEEEKEGGKSRNLPHQEGQKNREKKRRRRNSTQKKPRGKISWLLRLRCTQEKKKFGTVCCSTFKDHCRIGNNEGEIFITFIFSTYTTRISDRSTNCLLWNQKKEPPRVKYPFFFFSIPSYNGPYSFGGGGGGGGGSGGGGGGDGSGGGGSPFIPRWFRRIPLSLFRRRRRPPSFRYTPRRIRTFSLQQQFSFNSRISISRISFHHFRFFLSSLCVREEKIFHLFPRFPYAFE